jgi:hypothetical protein
MLSVVGKDEARVREMLFRGTLVAGASRFRWPGWEVDQSELHDLMSTFPDPDPNLPFDGGHCLRAVFHGGRQAIELPREVGEHRGLLQKRTFWQVLMETTAAANPSYHGYSYRDRADRYWRDFDLQEIERLRQAADYIRYTSVRDQIAAARFTAAEFFTLR